MGSIETIPDVVPERSITSLGINWPAADSAGLPLADGHVHVSQGVVPLSGIELASQPLADVALVDALGWDEVTAAMFVHVETSQVNGEVLLLAALTEDGPVAVAVPGGMFPDEAGQPEFRAFLAHELLPRVQAGTIATVEDNLARLLAYAGEFATYVARDTPAPATTQDPEPGGIDPNWQNRPGSIFLHG